MKKFAAVLALLALPVFVLADSNVVTSPDSGSYVSPSSATVLTGDTQTFSIGSDRNHVVTDVTVNGASQGVVSSVNITGDAGTPVLDPITGLQEFDPITGAPEFTPDTQTISVTSRPTGGIEPYCSSPTAPGWNVSLPGGGCGGTQLFVRYNQPLPDGTTCAFFNGCMAQTFAIKQ
jgi:hypothetical protein